MKNLIVKIVAICVATVLMFSLCGCAKGNKENNVLIKDAKLEESTYKLGDTMGDYTLTDFEGNTISFSEILKEKEAIVLNFWFSNCTPCKNEFPYLQNASKKYNDKLTVVAINPIDIKESKIEKFISENNITLPVVKGDPAWEEALSLQGYPTTVVVDRYGKIALYHVGALTEDGEFEKIFEFFTADDYEHTVVKNVNEIIK
ncbi:MAG: TlpA family protein disulfide reductase [Clostridia bacterium]|nr:TlpA family protein disulfide reductase [Clostridia bacterium]